MPRTDDDDEDRPRKRPRPRDDDDEDGDDPRPSRRLRRDSDDDDYADRPRKKRKKKPQPQVSVWGGVSLSLGVLALPLSFSCFGGMAIVPGLLGLVAGVIGFVAAQNSRGRQSPILPIGGSVVSLAATVVAVVAIVSFVRSAKEFQKDFKQAEADFEKEEAARKKEQASAAKEVKAAGAGGALPVTAVQFAQAYENNEEQADRLYKNKVLEVTGTVAELDFTGETYSVHLKAGADSQVYCQFAKTPEVRARLAQLQPGTQVTIRGKCLGDGPQIEACVLVE
jgi:hypothetical protein